MIGRPRRRPRLIFGSIGSWFKPWKGQNISPAPLASTRSSLVAAADDAEIARAREAVVLAVAISTPDMIAEFEGNLERMQCADAELGRLRDQVLRFGIDTPSDLKTRLRENLGE